MKKKIKKIIHKIWLPAIAVVVFCVVAVFFLVSNKSTPGIYVSPENPKQGDTVLIRVKSQGDKVAGNFGKSEDTAQYEQSVIFYNKENSDEWISFLGIDADQAPGSYKIYVNTSKGEHLTKEIKVVLADFSSATVVKAPSSSKTGVTIQKAVSNIIKNDNPALKNVLSKFTDVPYFASPFSFPLSKIEKTGFSFGKFIGFANNKIQHLGVDLRASEKTKVFSVNNGKVVGIFNLSNYGKTVIIDHGLDIFSLYLHLDEFKVVKGDNVKKGQIIGLSGETGYVTAPHLHFSMRVGTARVDPLVFIEATQKLDGTFLLADISSAFSNIINKK